MLGSVLVPVVVVGGVAVAVLPRALAARDDSDRQAAALAAADLPPGLSRLSGVAGLDAVGDDGPPERPTRTRLASPTPAPTTITIDAVAAAPAVDGAVTPPVDTAALQAEVSAVIAGTGATGAEVFGTDGATGIPVTVLAAYRKAETLLAAAKPSCHLPWWVLAGIGKVESDHASGGRVDANGTTRGRILGVALDGSMPGTAVILDSDGGRWDGDATYDRAVGPMQFLPGSWGAWGKDGNGDGVADPNNVFDAATAAGYLLCSAGDLADPATLTRAILMYNHSASYVATVLRWGTAYRDGATPSPDSPGAVPTTPVQQNTSPPSAAPPAPAAPSSSSEPPSSTSPAPSPSSPSSPSSSSSSSSSTSPSASSSTTTPSPTTTSSTTTTEPPTTTTTPSPTTTTTSPVTTTTTTTTTTTRRAPATPNSMTSTTPTP